MHVRHFVPIAVLALLFVSFLPAPRGAEAVGFWLRAPALVTERGYHQAVPLPDGRILFLGGGGFNSETTVELYDPTLGSTSKSPVPESYTKNEFYTARLVLQRAVPLPDGRVLIAGGRYVGSLSPSHSHSVDTVFIYDPATDGYERGEFMLHAHAWHTATPLRDGTVLVVGGFGTVGIGPSIGQGAIAEAERYDPRTGRWSPAGALRVARGEHAATLLADGRVLVTGGRGANGPIAEAEVYDPVTGGWDLAGTPAARLGHAAVALRDGRVLVAGGARSFAPRGADDYLAGAELYDPQTGRWTATAPMQGPRAGAVAALLPDGQVLLAGGAPAAAASTAELFDPATGRWTAIAPLSAARPGASATPLPDGRVLVAGGGTDTAELFDPGLLPQRCFAETGRCIRGLFLRYWEEHGGLALNGLPLSDERIEPLEGGEPRIVQWFERVRLEYHPENAAPNDVLLGQFGRRIYAQRHGREIDPPLPPPGGPSVPNAAYFPETGHYVTGRFFAYWEANGGLAQFGYPLGEAYVERLEDGKEYTVQYFERARFEYHPENPPPHDVLLGQFGRRLLDETGAMR